jgi:dTDP-4-dehydrorhamnose 3,5-epimerase
VKFENLKINDIIKISSKIMFDERGYFYEKFRADKLNEFLGYNFTVVQENESFSVKNVFRGLHFQTPPFCQSKLISVIEGEIEDFIVDIRRGSPTFKKSMRIKLTQFENTQLFIPRGFAHGFHVLSEKAKINYKVDNIYSKPHERIINVNDPELNFNIKKNIFEVSDKDKNSPFLNESLFLDYTTNYYE